MERYFVQHRRAGEIEWEEIYEPYYNLSQAEHTAQCHLNGYRGSEKMGCNEVRIVKRTYAVVDETVIPVVKKVPAWEMSATRRGRWRGSTGQRGWATD